MNPQVRRIQTVCLTTLMTRRLRGVHLSMTNDHIGAGQFKAKISCVSNEGCVAIQLFGEAADELGMKSACPTQTPSVTFVSYITL